MELPWIVLTCALALGILSLLLYLLSLRRSIREVAEELEEKLRTDTNTLISISSGVTSSVLKNVTMGLGASIQSSNAAARLVALGSTAVGLIAVLLWRWIHIRLCS